jgi:ABC-type transport system substrate-binding protein
VVDQLLDAGLATSDAAKRFAIYSQIVRRMATDEPYVPLFLVDSAIAVSNKFAVPGFNEWFVWGDYALDIKPSG